MSLSQQARTRLAVVAASFALPLLYFHRAVFTEQVFIARDMLRVYYPVKRYWAERVSQLQFPDWYPYDGLGQPFPGMLVGGAFHPANLLFVWLPLGTAMKLVVMLSYVAALAGTYLFARVWGMSRSAGLLAGLTYGLGGYMVGISNNLPYLMASATFPWALGGAERFLREPSAARAASAALPLCLVLLSGDPQSFAMCNTLLLVLVLLRPDRASALKVAPRAGLLIVLGALLSSVQILSIFSTLNNAYPSARDVLVATRFSFHPLRLAEFVLGPIYTHPETGMPISITMVAQLFQSPLGGFWVYSVYMGLPALLLLGTTLWVWRRHPLTWKVTAVALVVLALMMARHLPLYRWFYQWVPLWKSFRSPEKLLPYFLFPCALGAGAGLELLRRDVSGLARRLGLVAFGLALPCGLLALGEWQGRLFSEGLIRTLWEEALPDVLERLHGNVIHAAVVAAGMFCALGLVLLQARQPVPRAAALLALQFAALYLAHENTYHLSYAQVLEQPTAMVEALLRDATDADGVAPRVYAGVEDVSPRRVPEGLSALDVLTLNIAAALEPDTPGLFRLESARAYLPAVSARVGRLLELSHVREAWLERLAALYNTRYITLDARAFEQGGGSRKAVLGEDSLLGAVLLRNPRTLPRAYLATPRCVADRSAALDLILSQDFQPGRDVALECPAGSPADAGPAGTGEPPGQVRIVHYAPESVELDVEARQPTVLVLNDAWYDGWLAAVDGQPTPILPANVAVRGVRVPAGSHRVSFSYRTPGLVPGALVSLGCLVLLGLAVLVERRRAGRAFGKRPAR
jgi:hypothetical protein